MAHSNKKQPVEQLQIDKQFRITMNNNITFREGPLGTLALSKDEDGNESLLRTQDQEPLHHPEVFHLPAR